MAYQNPYYPYPYYLAQQPSTQNRDTGLVWVQGEAGAKSYLVAPGATVLLMDAEGSKFYLKSADASGVPLPLRVFKYEELGKQEPVMYVTKEEFEKFKEEMIHAKPTV